MQTRIQEWGYSLGLRIPKSFADEIGVEESSSVEVMLKEGTPVVLPIAEQRWTLEQILAGVTEENIHAGWEAGPAMGKENW